MAQLNVGLDDANKARFDAFAAAEGLASGTLGRSVILEYLNAREQGRGLFEPAELPIDPDTAVTLAIKVEQISIDLDRILRAAERREKRLLQAFHATEEANRDAVGRLSDELTKRFSQGATPFSELLTNHGEQVGQLHRDILTAVRSPEWMEDVNARLDTIEAAAKNPRTLNQYEIAPNWRLPAWQLGVAAIIALFAAATIIAILARIVPDRWIATPMSSAMYGSEDRGMCELWKAKNDFDACPVLVPMTKKPTP